MSKPSSREIGRLFFFGETMITADQARQLLLPSDKIDEKVVSAILNYAEVMIKEAARNGDQSCKLSAPFYEKSRATPGLSTHSFPPAIYNAVRTALKESGFGVEPEYCGKHTIIITWYMPLPVDVVSKPWWCPF
jgi:hypothetical protein